MKSEEIITMLEAAKEEVTIIAERKYNPMREPFPLLLSQKDILDKHNYVQKLLDSAIELLKCKERN
jgi:hypothetical protein